MTIKEVGDCVETVLRVEIISDTPEKVEACRDALCALILDSDFLDPHDVMVTINDITVDTEGQSK